MYCSAPGRSRTAPDHHCRTGRKARGRPGDLRPFADHRSVGPRRRRGHDEPGVVVAEIDPAASAEARKKIPNLKNARPFEVANFGA